MIESIGATLNKLASRLAALRRQSQFSCGDCERWERCGLPPNETCVIKLEQMSREDRKLKRRVTALRPW